MKLEVLDRNQWKISVVRDPDFVVSHHIHGVAVAYEWQLVSFGKFRVLENGITTVVKAHQAMLTDSVTEHPFVEITHPDLASWGRLDVFDCIP
jgi:hypothetical protein